MGFRLATLFVDVEVKQSNYQASLANLSAMLGGLVVLSQKWAEQGSNLYETMNKIAVTFGSSQQAVLAMANDMAAKYGIVKNVSLDAAANFGLIGQAAGMTEAQSAALAVSMTRLADDASSFFNVPVDVALEKIRSGLVGQARPLREFGVLLSKSAVDHQLLAMGIQKTHGEYSEAEKVMARVKIITEGLSKAQGDHERTMGSYINQMRKLRGEVENYTTQIGAGVAGAEAQFLVNVRDKGIMGALGAHGSDVMAQFSGTRDTKFQEAADIAAGVQRARVKENAPEPGEHGFGMAGSIARWWEGAESAVNRLRGERPAGHVAAGVEEAAAKAVADANAVIAAGGPAANVLAKSPMESWIDMFNKGAKLMEEDAATAEYVEKNRRNMEQTRFLADYFMYDTKSAKQYADEARKQKESAKAENEFMEGFLGLDTPAGKGGASNIRDKMESFHAQSMGVAEFAAKLRMEQKGGDVPAKQLTELQQIRKAEMDQAKAMAKLAERGFPAVLA